MEDLLSSYRLIKGKPCDLTADLEENILGLRKTAMGFEGLITANVAAQYKHCVLDTATIDDIIICIGKGGKRHDRGCENYKTGFFYNEITSNFIFSLVAVILIFGLMGSPITVLCITGAWFIALMATNIFAIQEKIILTVYMVLFA